MQASMHGRATWPQRCGSNCKLIGPARQLATTARNLGQSLPARQNVTTTNKQIATTTRAWEL
eukprot:3026884-Lingulodinium_polyedra.AAC.1